MGCTMSRAMALRQGPGLIACLKLVVNSEALNSSLETMAMISFLGAVAEQSMPVWWDLPRTNKTSEYENRA